MSFDVNNKIIPEHSDRELFLFDNVIFVKSEQLAALCGIDFIEVFDTLPEEYFFVSNDVMVELMNCPRSIDAGYLL